METRLACPLCSSEIKKTILTTDGMDVVQCSDCDFIYLKDIPDESILYESYHEWTGFYQNDYSESGQEDSLKALWHINKQRIQKIKDFKTSGDLLDIGCGSGAFMLTALEHGFNPFGIDVSNKAIEFISNELKLRASTDTVFELDQQFDVITFWHVLEHFLDPVEELIKIHKKLKQDGMVFGEVPNWNSIKFQLSGKKWEGGNHPLYHRSFFTPKTLEEAFKKAGFSKFKILHVPYTSLGKKDAYYFLKKGFNTVNRDAFLTFEGWR